MTHIGLFVSHVGNPCVGELFYVPFVSHSGCFVSLSVIKVIILEHKQRHFEPGLISVRACEAGRSLICSPFFIP